MANQEDGKFVVYMDGNMWCATREDFDNLQESLAGFGPDPLAAIEDLLKQERP